MDDQCEAAAYAAADFARVNQAFVERLVEFVGPDVPMTTVDLGTGPADIPVRLVRARTQWHVTAIDASAAMLDIGRKAIERAGMGDAIRLVLADAKDTGLPDSAFDVVFSNSILHHIADVQPLWREVRRIAKPGAFIFLRDLARPGSEAEARQIVETYSGDESDLLKEEFFRSLLSAYTTEEVRGQLQEARLGGLCVEMVTDRHLDIFGRLLI